MTLLDLSESLSLAVAYDEANSKTNRRNIRRFAALRCLILLQEDGRCTSAITSLVMADGRVSQETVKALAHAMAYRRPRPGRAPRRWFPSDEDGFGRTPDRDE